MFLLASKSKRNLHNNLKFNVFTKQVNDDYFSDLSNNQNFAESGLSAIKGIMLHVHVFQTTINR